MTLPNFSDEAARAWCRIPLANGNYLRTNSASDLPEGARFVALEDAAGNVRCSWLSVEWGDPARAEATMAAIGAAAAGGVRVVDEDYGEEFSVVLAGGATLRVESTGTAVRIVAADGTGIGGELAYWLSDEWIEDPEEAMGAILGATRLFTP